MKMSILTILTRKTTAHGVPEDNTQKTTTTKTAKHPGDGDDDDDDQELGRRGQRRPSGNGDQALGRRSQSSRRTAQEQISNFELDVATIFQVGLLLLTFPK